jgi:UDP-2,3-diacylglucosamine pyrophosphatase LpxH
VLYHYKTIVISDVPLGTDRKNLKKLIYFLKKNTCDRLILSGDFIKGWQISTINKIYKRQAFFLNTLFKLIEKHGTEIIFITGQKEMIKHNSLSVKFGNFSFHKDYILNSGSYKYKVIHGDILNKSATAGILPSFKTIPYLAYLYINNRYNEYRYGKGLSYKSVLKGTLFGKAEHLFMNNIRENLIKLASKDDCDGVICGNNHSPCIHQIGTVGYLNSGFWSESNVGLVESNTGNWKLLSMEETREGDKEARRFYRKQKKLMERAVEKEESLKVKIA